MIYPVFFDELNNMKWFVELDIETEVSFLCCKLRGTLNDGMKVEGKFSSEIYILVHENKV